MVLRGLKRSESRIQESTSFHPFVGNLHPSLTPFFRREGSIAGSTQGSIRRWESTERQPTTLERRLPLSKRSAFPLLSDSSMPWQSGAPLTVRSDALTLRQTGPIAHPTRHNNTPKK